MKEFKFVFMLHLMKDILRITNNLSEDTTKNSKYYQCYDIGSSFKGEFSINKRRISRL